MSDQTRAGADIRRPDLPPRRVPEHGEWKARRMSTEYLKVLWDRYDGVNTADPEISGEAVHLVLNERGEGAYCAV